MKSKSVEFNKETKEELFKLFGRYVTPKLTKRKGGDVGDSLYDLEIDCGNCSQISFTMLTKVSEIFGTNKIDVNNEIVGGGGCESCSYEEIEVKIQIYEPVKNVPTEQP
jgi:hypothetical protein